MIFREKIDPTIYDEKIHGIMTDEERHKHNQQLLDRIPERNSRDATARLKYECLMADGETEEAALYREGYERDLSWEETYRSLRKQILVTRDEYKTRQKKKKQLTKDMKKALQSKGITGLF